MSVHSISTSGAQDTTYALSNTQNIGKQPGRKTRWNHDQILALVEGVEKHGLGAWSQITRVGVI